MIAPICICNPYGEPDTERAPNCEIHGVRATKKTYPCGCNATGPEVLPDYCPEHDPELSEQGIRNLYSRKSAHYGGGFGQEVRFLLSHCDRLQRELDAAKLELQSVVGTIQQLQPSGSPPGGGPIVLVPWIVRTTAELITTLRERAEKALEQLHIAESIIDQQTERAEKAEAATEGWWDQNAVQCGNCSVEIVTRKGHIPKNNGLSDNRGSEDEQLCGRCAGMQMYDYMDDIEKQEQQIAALTEERNAANLGN